MLAIIFNTAFPGACWLWGFLWDMETAKGRHKEKGRQRAVRQSAEPLHFRGLPGLSGAPISNSHLSLKTPASHSFCSSCETKHRILDEMNLNAVLVGSFFIDIET